jgi:hypothetical protein
VHLLRQVCETCTNYDEARQRLSEIPLRLPALFTLAGTKSGEGCVIERSPGDAVRRDMPVAIGNHWISAGRRGRPRGAQSTERAAQMNAALAGTGSWLRPPIINRHTRLVAAINPAHGRLTLQGWEKDGPASAPLTLQST